MTFAVISDIHKGPERLTRRGDLRKLSNHSEELVKKFVSEMNSTVHPSFVMQLGDVIENDTPENDYGNYQNVLKLFSELQCPFYNVIGNHDILNLSEQQLKELTSQEELFYSFRNNGYKFITLFSKKNEDGRILISEPQLVWLKEELSEENIKTIVFVHHSLADQNLAGNYWFEGLPEKCLIENREVVRELLENSKNVVGIINGHLHWNQMNVHNGIPYFNVQSLVENFQSDGTPSASYALVNVNTESIKVTILGNDAAQYEFTSEIEK